MVQKGFNESKNCAIVCYIFAVFAKKQSLKSYFIPYNPARIARASCERSLILSMLKHYRGTMHVRVQVCGLWICFAIFHN